MERLLTKLLPGIDFTEELENLNEVQPLLHQHAETLPRNDEDSELPEDLKLNLNPENNRFFGKSRCGSTCIFAAFQVELNPAESNWCKRP
ncbi:hypothetical protein B0H19DRAFT_1094839 [Mycena capillaripes]|nr:hypothetical protein B0H19DRAFT_1094839 [Mycena capillaripes]